MKIARLVVFAFGLAVPLGAQDRGTMADIDEAFRLTGVRTMLESLPSHVNEMTVAAIAQFPKEQRQQFTPMIKEVSLKFMAPDAFYRQLRADFARHYNGKEMATFLALERTPAYRSMHHLEAAAVTPAEGAARHRFEVNLKSDPPDARRVDILQRLDEATNTTGVQVRLVIGIVNAMAGGLGAQMPADLDTQSTAFSAKIRPVLASNVLNHNLYAFRNSDNSDLEDYVAAAQQPSVIWFNRNLQNAILAVAAERAARAGEAIKTKAAQPLN